MRNSVIIVAGGSGSRMGSEIPKQFLEIEGKAMIVHTLEKFLEFDPKIEIILVLKDTYLSQWESAKQKGKFDYPVKIANGGETRFHSVKNGLTKLEGLSLVGIHDAVRPLVSIETIRRVYKAAMSYGCAIPCVALKESVRKITGDKSVSIDRNLIKIVQTPQVFHSSIIVKSYETLYSDVFTDDASVFESAGNDIKIVEGDEYNIKITTPEDLEIARVILGFQKQRLH